MPIKFINDYFGFNRQQRNGVAVLAAICLLLFLIRLSYPYLLEDPKVEVLFLPSVRAEKSMDSHADSSGPALSVVQRKLFLFDPNTATREELIELGFAERTAATLDKFRKKGFHFRKPEDLRKVYGLKDEFYNRIKEYVRISPRGSPAQKQPAEQSPEQKPEQKPAFSKKQLIDLNTADSVLLVTVNGIGPAYARRIVRYRESLGGFVNLGQLKEIYGFTPEVIAKLEGSFIIANTNVRKIDLNRDDFKTINRHPYLSYELTRKIFDWRRKTNITQANVCDVLGEEALCSRMMPYLFLAN